MTLHWLQAKNRMAYHQSLTALVRFDAPIAELRGLFSDLPHDYGDEPVIMTKAHMAHALQQFIDGNITATDLEI